MEPVLDDAVELEPLVALDAPAEALERLLTPPWLPDLLEEPPAAALDLDEPFEPLVVPPASLPPTSSRVALEVGLAPPVAFAEDCGAPPSESSTVDALTEPPPLALLLLELSDAQPKLNRAMLLSAQMILMGQPHNDVSVTTLAESNARRRALPIRAKYLLMRLAISNQSSADN